MHASSRIWTQYGFTTPPPARREMPPARNAYATTGLIRLRRRRPKVQTFSVRGVPRIPVGFHRSTRMRITKAIPSRYAEDT
jgi:hypothetical protein